MRKCESGALRLLTSSPARTQNFGQTTASLPTFRFVSANTQRSLSMMDSLSMACSMMGATSTALGFGKKYRQQNESVKWALSRHMLLCFVVINRVGKDQSNPCFLCMLAFVAFLRALLLSCMPFLHALLFPLFLVLFCVFLACFRALLLALFLSFVLGCLHSCFFSGLADHGLGARCFRVLGARVIGAVFARIESYFRAWRTKASLQDA